MTALDLADGRVLWSVRLGLYGDAGVRPVRTAAGLVIGTGAGEVMCLSPDDGAIRWSRPIGASIEDELFATRGESGVVVVPGADGRLAALAVADGSTRWEAGPGEMAVATAPRMVDDAVFAYAAAGHGLGIRGIGDGELKVRPVATRALAGAPSADVGRIWAATRDGTMCVFSAATGKALKSFPLPTVSPYAPAVVGDTAFVTCTDGAVAALRADGERLFTTPLPAAAGATPAFVDGQLFVPGSDGVLYVLDATRGSLVWRYDAGSPLLATPTVTEGAVLLATSRGRIVALRR